MSPVQGAGEELFPRRVPSRESVGPILAAVSAGGAVGAGGRYLAGVQWPTAAGTPPLTTAAINLLGSLAIGVLMVVVAERFPHRRLVRPFIGTGVLGGFTTFSAYAVDVQTLATGGQPTRLFAAVYLFATPVLALLAAIVGSRVARMLLTRRSR